MTKYRTLKSDGAARGTVIRIVGDPVPAARSDHNPFLEALERAQQAVAATVAPVGRSNLSGRRRADFDAFARGIIEPKLAARASGGINRYKRHPLSSQATGQRIIGEVKELPPVPKVEPYQPDEGAVVALRAAFGLGVRSEQVTGTLRDMRTFGRQAEKRATAKAEAAKAAAPTKPVPSAPMDPAGGVHSAIARRCAAAGGLPVSISVSEIARELSTTPETVSDVIRSLERDRRLERHQRGAGVIRWLTR
jgi:hypothetical protein